MALPHLLLVDDSEAILAYERAALGDRYVLTTAHDGLDALEKLRSGVQLPDLIVLDLSMPRMDGEQLLSCLRADIALRELPVLLVSTESKRARALIGNQFVAGFLPKPIEAPSLRATIEKLLDEARWARSRAGLSILRVVVGPHTLALPLASVAEVVAQPLCTRIAGAASYLREIVDLHGEPVVVLDLARRLSVTSLKGYVDRLLVIVQAGGARIAVAVDEINDPEVVAAECVLAADKLGGSLHAPLDGLLVAVVRVETSASTTLVPVLRPEAFLSRGLLRDVGEALAGAAAAGIAP